MIKNLSVLLLLANVTVGQDIKLPKEITAQVGQPVTITAETDGTIVKWKVADTGLYHFDPNLQITTKSLQVLALAPGRYRVFACTAKDNVPSDFAEVTVIVGGAPPVPPVPPTPPNPPTPDNLSDTAKKVRDWARQVGNKAEAKKIQNNFESMSASINAGAYNGVEFREAVVRIIVATHELNSMVTKENEEWTTKFFQNIRQMLNAQQDNLDTLPKISKMYDEIAIGLGAM